MGILERPISCAVPPGPVVAISSVETRDGDGEIRGYINVARGWGKKQAGKQSHCFVGRGCYFVTGDYV